MKQIFNWTIGSFFRTIGRTIALLVLGALLYFIISSNDIRLTDLFIMKVKADSWGNQLITINNCNGSSCEMLSNAPTIYGLTYHMNSTKVSESTNTTFNMNVALNNNNLVEFYVYIFGPGGEAVVPRMNISGNIYTNKGVAWCTSVNESNQTGYYTLSCPVLKDSTYLYNVSITAQYNWNKTIAGILKTGISPFINLKYDSNVQIIQKQQETNDLITNQTQQEQQQHEEAMNSSTEDAESDAEGFFDDFDVPDSGGLSAIITAPLNTINSLLTNSCSNLVLPLPFVNEDLTLPCLYSIYNQYFGAFFTLYQTIILAIVSYRCIRSIYFDITGFMNPDDDRIEVMDL